MSVWALGRGKSFGKQMFILFFCLKPIHQFTLDGQVLPKELLGNNERKYRLGEWHRQRKGLWWEDVSMTVLGKRMWQTAHCCRPQVSASLFLCFALSTTYKKCEGHVQALFQQSTPRTVYSQRDQWDPIPGELSLGCTVSIDTPLWTTYPLSASKLIFSWALQNPVVWGPPEEIISFRASWAC